MDKNNCLETAILAAKNAPTKVPNHALEIYLWNVVILINVYYQLIPLKETPREEGIKKDRMK